MIGKRFFGGDLGFCHQGPSFCTPKALIARKTICIDSAFGLFATGGLL
jgi:hypothetical protein